MRKRKLNRNGWLCLIVLGVLIAGGIIAQVQVSGGSAVTQSGAWNITNITGTVSLPTGAATETTLAGRLKPADTLAGVTTLTSITNAVNVVPKTACGNTLATGSTLAAVPTSSTLLTSAATACAIAALFFNTNSSAATVTLTDNTATPINAVLTFSIPGNSNLAQPLYGGAFNLGIKWSASGTGVTGYVVAYQ